MQRDSENGVWLGPADNICVLSLNYDYTPLRRAGYRKLCLHIENVYVHQNRYINVFINLLCVTSPHRGNCCCCCGCGWWWWWSKKPIGINIWWWWLLLLLHWDGFVDEARWLRSRLPLLLFCCYPNKLDVETHKHWCRRQILKRCRHTHTHKTIRFIINIDIFCSLPSSNTFVGSHQQ